MTSSRHILDQIEQLSKRYGLTMTKLPIELDGASPTRAVAWHGGLLVLGMDQATYAGKVDWFPDTGKPNQTLLESPMLTGMAALPGSRLVAFAEMDLSGYLKDLTVRDESRISLHAWTDSNEFSLLWEAKGGIPFAIAPSSKPECFVYFDAHSRDIREVDADGAERTIANLGTRFAKGILSCEDGSTLVNSMGRSNWLSIDTGEERDTILRVSPDGKISCFFDGGFEGVCTGVNDQLHGFAEIAGAIVYTATREIGKLTQDGEPIFQVPTEFLHSLDEGQTIIWLSQSATFATAWYPDAVYKISLDASS